MGIETPTIKNIRRHFILVIWSGRFLFVGKEAQYLAPKCAWRACRFKPSWVVLYNCSFLQSFAEPRTLIALTACARLFRSFHSLIQAPLVLYHTTVFNPSSTHSNIQLSLQIVLRRGIMHTSFRSIVLPLLLGTAFTPSKGTSHHSIECFGNTCSHAGFSARRLRMWLFDQCN